MRRLAQRAYNARFQTPRRWLSLAMTSSCGNAAECVKMPGSHPMERCGLRNALVRIIPAMRPRPIGGVGPRRLVQGTTLYQGTNEWRRLNVSRRGAPEARGRHLRQEEKRHAHDLTRALRGNWSMITVSYEARREETPDGPELGGDGRRAAGPRK